MMLSEFMDLIQLELTSESVVWHYTRAPGALGIIEGKSLHAASISLLNDSGELFHGIDVIRQYFRDKPTDLPQEKLTSSWFRHAAESLVEAKVRNSFVVSASESGELQPLFLLYGSYAIGINSRAGLTKDLADVGAEYKLDPSFEFGWRRVIYAQDRKLIVCQQLYAALIELAKLDSDLRFNKNCERCLLAQEAIFQVAVYFKEESSSHEKEVRLYGRAKETSAKMNFKTSTYGILPYLEVTAKPLTAAQGERLNFPIERINLGPGLLASQSAKIGLELALETYRYKSGSGPVIVNILRTTRRPG